MRSVESVVSGGDIQHTVVNVQNIVMPVQRWRGWRTGDGRPATGDRVSGEEGWGDSNRQLLRQYMQEQRSFDPSQHPRRAVYSALCVLRDALVRRFVGSLPGPRIHVLMEQLIRFSEYADILPACVCEVCEGV